MDKEAKKAIHNDKVRINYNNKIHNNPTFYAKEKKRVAKYQFERYNTDKTYKKKIQEYNKMKMREYAVINKLNNIRL
jgi:hypothetical protein